MKILHIIDSGGLYGAEIMLLNLVEEQIKLGLVPIIASIGEKGISEKPLERETFKRGFNLQKFRMLPGLNFAGAVKILRFAQNESVAILHSHGYKGNILFGLIPKRFRRIPLLATIHGWTSANNTLTKLRLYEWIDYRILKYIDAIVLVSEAMKFHPKLKKIKLSSLHFIPNGIPITNHNIDGNQEIRKAEKSKKTILPSGVDAKIVSFCKEGYTICAIGRLAPEKCFTNLIEAMGILHSRDHDVKLVIIGEGRERNNLQNLIAKLNLKNKIFLPGYRENAKKYLPFCKAFVLSSRTEGLPITILEAMQTKIPIIATKVGGVPETLQNGKAGILVNTSEPSLLADAIEKLLTDHELGNHLTVEATKIFNELYSSRRMAKQYLDIYEKCLMRPFPS